MEGNKTENNIELTEEEKEMRKRFFDKNPEMTESDWVAIRQNIFKEDGAKNPATRIFCEINGLIIPIEEMPDRDELGELNPKN